MDEVNVPADATAMQAEEIVRSAIAWRYKQDLTGVYTIQEWELIKATDNYGDRYKGLRSR